MTGVITIFEKNLILCPNGKSPATYEKLRFI